MSFALTDEQRKVIEHPIGQHAKVLAVAGSGKTTTMVHRIEHLVNNEGVSPDKIQVLMFNRLARQEFKHKLEKIDLGGMRAPPVNTFHSFSMSFIEKLRKQGIVPQSKELWIDDTSERSGMAIVKAIKNLQRRHAIPDEVEIDLNRAEEAIDLWKNSLIPPDRAGYRQNSYYPLIYAEYEKIRTEAGAITYNDMIGMAVQILQGNRNVRESWCGRFDHIIVDEYQDVNYAQQTLIELLAGKYSDVMVVGDDDQTIYEWRGARPSYILKDFEERFTGKQHQEYRLSRTFRFGPVLAQAAHNCITNNRVRKEKNLVSNKAELESYIKVISTRSEQGADVNRDLVDAVVDLVRGTPDQRGSPEQVIVLCRMYCQLAGVEAELLRRHLPYRVVGKKPFFERNEIQTLLTYMRLAKDFDEVLDQEKADQFARILNVPNRMLPKVPIKRLIDAKVDQITVRGALTDLVEGLSSPLTPDQREKVEDIPFWLNAIKVRIDEDTMRAGDMLTWIINGLGYLKHYDNFYGQGEESADRKLAISEFVDYAVTSQLKPADFLEHVDGLDSTLEAPMEDQLVLTSIYRTKGLEYGYVIMPECSEGNLPCLGGSNDLFRNIYDKAGIVQNPASSDPLDNERRLYYVGITRARRGVVIGTSEPPKRGIMGVSPPDKPSRFIEESLLTPSYEVMGALRHYAATGEKKAEDSLHAAAVKNGQYKGIISNLCGHYLLDLGEEKLAGRISKATEDIQAHVAVQAPPPGEDAGRKDKKKPPTKDPWGRY